MFRTVLVLLSGNATGSILLFARNLIIARMISVEDYGIAATFALSMGVVEMMSELGLQKLIIQDRNGDDPDFQAGLQGFHLLRGVFAGIVLFFLAHPIAAFLGASDIAWAYQLLSIVPVIKGFEHFDIHRLNRHQKFLPLVVHKVLPSALGLASIWPLFFFVNDYRVMLYSVIIQRCFGIIVSHLMAERLYHLKFNTTLMRQSLVFGWPLLLNNMLLFGVMEGDRVIVSGALGLEAFAVFSMGLTLTMTPAIVFSSSMFQVLLPRFSAIQDDSEQFIRLTILAIRTSLWVGVLLVTATVLVGPPIIQFLLGEKYALVIPLLAWLAIQQAVRVFKTGGTIAALAKAQTSNAMLANIARSLMLVPTWYVAVLGGGLQSVILIGIAGEIAAFAVSLGVLAARLDISLRSLFVPITGVIIFLAAIAFHAAQFSESGHWGRMGTIAVGLAIMLTIEFWKHAVTYWQNLSRL